MTLAHPALDTALCRLTGIRYPIVQTGMGYVADATLAAATSEAGGLGIIASATMSVPELAAAVHAVKDATDAPFAVNMRSDSPDILERVDLVIQAEVRVASFALAP